MLKINLFILQNNKSINLIIFFSNPIKLLVGNIKIIMKIFSMRFLICFLYSS